MSSNAMRAAHHQGAYFQLPDEAPRLHRDEREALERDVWFASLPPLLRHDILRVLQIDRYRDGQPLADPLGGQHHPWMGCVRGAVRICSEAFSDLPHTLDFAGPGQWFSLGPAGDAAGDDLGPDEPGVYAVAHRDTTVVRIPRAAMAGLLQRHPSFGPSLLRQSALQTRRLMERTDDLKSLSLGQRLAKQLALMAGQAGPLGEGGPARVVLDMAQHELASLLGASRQRINQQLKRLEQLNAIQVATGRLLVRDHRMLQRIGEQGC